MTLLKKKVSYSWSITVCLLLTNLATAFELDSKKLAEQLDMTKYPAGSRVEILASDTDPRLSNGQCPTPKLSFPKGTKPWGKTLVHVHCDGQSTSFYQSVDVRVWSIATVAQNLINFQETFSVDQLKMVEVDLTKLPPMGWSGNSEDLIGKQSTRQIASGTLIRADMFKSKAAIQSGDTVKISVKGAGFRVASDGVALTSANLGQTIRVRTPQGKVLTGEAKNDLMVEVTL
jgi:flagella basal body P-ring formation protein FlgA